MATAEKQRTAEIHDIGPIDTLTIPIPAEGGVVVLCGPNGAGKTTAIESLATVASGKGKLQVKDGADRGEVRLGSVTLRVGKNQRRTGELDVSVIPGRYTIADLIAPGYKDRDSCDAHAIKTLAQLTGAADESLFYDLAGGREEFEKICPSDVAGDLDVVALAGRVERALQKRARDEESLATAADSKADAFSTGARDVDLEAEHDSDKLQQALHQAISEEAKLSEQAQAATKKLLDAGAARDALEDAEAELKGLTVAQAEEAHRAAAKVSLGLEADIDDAEKALAALKSRHAVAQAESIATKQAWVSAQNSQQVLEKFRATVAASQGVKRIPDEDLQSAASKVKQAKVAVEQGALIRKALADKQSATEWRHKAGQHRKGADQLREAAAGTDDVLSTLVGKLGSKLFVKKGRLMVTSDRGDESFWDLSDGERSEIAVTVFATHVGKNGLLPLPQSFWEGLDWSGRKRIAEHMKRVGVVAITAEADKDEEAAGALRAEVYQS